MRYQVVAATTNEGDRMNVLELREHVLKLEKELGGLKTTITRLESEEVIRWSPTYGKYIVNHAGVANKIINRGDV